MKRYALFAYSLYYPRGGFRDFAGDFDSIEECNDELEKLKQGTNTTDSYLNSSYYHYHIMDTTNWQIAVEEVS